MSAAPLLWVVSALLGGALLGALAAYLRAARRIEALRIELAGAQARLEARAAQEADQQSLLEQSETRLRAAFDSLAGETLRSQSEIFLRLAREALGRDQAVAQGAMKERELNPNRANILPALPADPPNSAKIGNSSGTRPSASISLSRSAK